MKLRIAKWAFSLAAIAGLGACVWTIISTVRLLVVGQRTMGEVVGMEHRPSASRKSRSGGTYAPVVVFTTTAGHKIKFVSPGSGSEHAFSVGERVPVLYDQADPSHARIGTFMHLWGGAVLSLLLGLGLLLATGILWALDAPEKPGRRRRSRGASRA
jgi:hypothetical protein